MHLRLIDFLLGGAGATLVTVLIKSATRVVTVKCYHFYIFKDDYWVDSNPARGDE